MTTETVKTGAELKVGDIINVWWPPYWARITALTPYRGPLEHLFPQGASIARFHNFGQPRTMTIDNAAWDFRVYSDNEVSA